MSRSSEVQNAAGSREELLAAPTKAVVEKGRQAARTVAVLVVVLSMLSSLDSPSAHVVGVHSLHRRLEVKSGRKVGQVEEDPAHFPSAELWRFPT